MIERLRALVGLDSEWERPNPTAAERRADVAVAVALFLDTVLFLELMRSFADFEGSKPVVVEYLAVAALAAPLAVRRRFPVAVALYAAAHMILTGILVPETAYQIPMQIGYFLAFFTALAWGKDRRVAVLTIGAVLLAMAAWLALTYAVGSGLDAVHRDIQGQKTPPKGLFPPITASVLLTCLSNLLYFGGAIAWGAVAWHAARNKVVIAQQNRRLEEQAEELRDQAVVDERLRIARELHDVVAHHVSVMGVQAGAARRVLAKDPAAAASALSAVESSSRQAVGEMRALLGTLRAAPAAEVDDRAPQPTLRELPQLAASYAESGLDVAYALVEDTPGEAERLPMPVALILYRTAQEALTNVVKHSSARTASVTVRVTHAVDGARYAEVEVLDDGRPLGGTSGTGLGTLGMRERIASLDGQVEIGPRLTGGYRVRVRVPLTS